jgi:type I restriction enzyme S subunit
VWKGEVDPCIHQNHIFCARLYLPEVSPEWVSMTGQLEYARDYVNSVASQSVNLASINSTNLKAMPIPLPSVQEQLRIVEKMKILYRKVNDVEIAVQIASRRLDKLEQAALAKAFRGEL